MKHTKMLEEVKQGTDEREPAYGRGMRQRVGLGDKVTMLQRETAKEEGTREEADVALGEGGVQATGRTGATKTNKDCRSTKEWQR